MRTFEITSLIVSNNVSLKTHPFTSHPSLDVGMWWYMTNTNIKTQKSFYFSILAFGFILCFASIILRNVHLLGVAEALTIISAIALIRLTLKK
jgi:hypothetical protein